MKGLRTYQIFMFHHVSMDSGSQTKDEVFACSYDGRQAILTFSKRMVVCCCQLSG